jgi:hypothetical protein
MKSHELAGSLLRRLLTNSAAFLLPFVLMLVAPQAYPQGVASVLPPTYSEPAPCSINALGSIKQIQPLGGARDLLHLTLHDTRSPLTVLSVTWDVSRTRATIGYARGNECHSAEPAITVHVDIGKRDRNLVVELHSDATTIASVDTGPWDARLEAQAISVPYYSGAVWLFPLDSTYANAWWHWNEGNGTFSDATSVRYERKTNGTLNELHEKLEVSVSSSLDEVFPAIPNPPSPYRAVMSGRMLVDIFDGDFATTSAGFRTLGDYGIGNCIAIIHQWQHGGFDNELPEHSPANQRMGGEYGLAQAIASGSKDGCLMALHENYIDYYPNFPGFDPASIALKSDGMRLTNWFNPDTGLRAFQTKPNWMKRNAEQQSPVIHQRYGTTASYIDVNSAVDPDRMRDMDAGEIGAGRRARWLQTAASLWAFERIAHAGPVRGEGQNHWFYSGLLDGAEAQLGAGMVGMNLGETLPLFVDFDLLRIHPLQVNQGMGLTERWSRGGSGDLTVTEQDAYRMQEIAFGHAPFIGRWSWSLVPTAMVESNLVTPVAKGYGLAEVTSILYRVGERWVNSSIAAKTKAFSVVQVGYNSGLTIVANASREPLVWSGLTLPQYGWFASNHDLLAYTALCGASVCDFAQTPTSIFANARNQQDLNIGCRQVAASAYNFQQQSGRQFLLDYDWRLLQSPDCWRRYTAFVHFVDDQKARDGNDGVVFQADHAFGPSTLPWHSGQIIHEGSKAVTIPDGVRDGTYSVRIGLYDPVTGVHVPLAGQVDGAQRLVAGKLTIAGNGSSISFVSYAETMPSALVRDMDSTRLNKAGTLVDFGVVKTDGIVSMQEDAKEWTLRVFPRNRNITILIRAADIPPPASIKAIGQTSTEIVPVMNQAYWRLTTNGASIYKWESK